MARESWSVGIQMNSFTGESENSSALGGPFSIVGCSGFVWSGGAPAGSPGALTASLAGAGGWHHTQELSRMPQLSGVHPTVGPQGESKHPRAQPMIRVTTSFLLNVKLGQLCSCALPPPPPFHSLRHVSRPPEKLP